MSVTRSKTSFKYNYILKGHTLESVETAKYLGITISSNMTWNARINNITSKAQKLLGYLRRNLQIKNEHTKNMAYKSLVRSNLEYCSTIWSPHTKKQKSEIEKVQRRAARYTTSRFHNTSSVTWNSLETRRNIAKVTMLCKIIHNLVAINPDFYISSQTSLTRHSHSLRYKPFSTSTDYFKFSFFPQLLSFGMHYHLILSLLLLWISLNHRSKPTTTKQFSILYKCKYVTFFVFFLLINCKYMVCSRRCIVVTIDGASYDVDVDLSVDTIFQNLRFLSGFSWQMFV